MESLCVRFHYRGTLEHNGKDWEYLGGKSGMSIVPIMKLTLADLKRHLADHINISDEDLQETHLSWRLIEKDQTLLCSLDENSLVGSMTRHVTSLRWLCRYLCMNATECSSA